jgi:undecaprenyl diphosphate synthase
MAGNIAFLPLEIPPERRPRHIAIIMDGNGRWAERQNLPRIAGHQRGVDSVRRTTEEAARLNIEQLTLYCLSSENWKRPQTEINFLMHLLEQYMIQERGTIMDNNVRVRMIGRRDDIPEQVLRELDKTVEMSSSNISNFLLWQISYAEIWVTEKCWPEFDEATLHEAIRAYAARRRRFGGLES